MKYFFVILYFLLLLAGCEGSSSSNDRSSPQLEAKFLLRDTFNQESDSFVQGEDIKFFLVVTNNSPNTVTLNFSSGQQYDFYISSSSNIEIWRWSADKVFTQATTELTIQPGQSFEISEIWDQTLASNGSIAIGSYSAFGSLLDQSQEIQFNFTIQ